MAAAWTARAASRSARGLPEMERRCRFVLRHRLCSCFVVIARPSSGSVCRRPLELAAPRKNKGPGGWSRPGLWFTRDRRGSGRHSDERGATEVTGGHPGLGTTTGRRQLHPHGEGCCPSRRRVSRASRTPRCALQSGTLVARLPGVRPPRTVLLLLLLICALSAACGRDDRKPGAAARPRTSPRSVRITMDALHQLGGIPPGWQLTPLPGDVEAGRRGFEDLGCATCHKVAGETFADQANGGPGPELTGMGIHHPPAYFLESI